MYFGNYGMLLDSMNIIENHQRWLSVAQEPIYAYFDRIVSSSIDRRMLHCILLLELGLVVGVASVFNFALGFFTGLVFLPLCTLSTATAHRRFTSYMAKTALLTFANPVALLLIWTLATMKYRGIDLTASFERLCDTVDALVVDEFAFGSWIYRFLCLCLTPVWLITAWST